jgi:hypothetical protein
VYKVYNKRIQAEEEEMETEDITIQFRCDESECDGTFTKKSSEITSSSVIEGAVDDINKAFRDLGDINIDLGL